MGKLGRNIGRLFGIGGGEKPESKAEHQKPLGSLFGVRGFEDLFGRVQGRAMRREGLGLTPGARAGDTQAFAAQRRAGLREQTIPQITQAASARGLGRSTLPVGQIGLASQAAERDIESRVAERQLQSETLAAQQEQQALARLQGLIGAEAQTQQTRRLAEGGEFERIAGLRREMDKESLAGAGRLASAISPLAQDILKTTTGKLGFAKGEGIDFDLAGAVEGGNSAEVAKSSSSIDLKTILKLLGGV